MQVITVMFSAKPTAPGPENRVISQAPTIIQPPSGLPSLYIVGDSTAADSTRIPTIQGWGMPFLTYFNADRINVVNAARGGRSSRTYLTEGLFDELIAKLRLGDIVLIQWGHNDAYDINENTGRGSLHGIGEETEQITRNGKPEIVHTFGWYMRDEVARIRATGALPVILTLTIRDRWNADGTIERLPKPNLSLADTNRFHEPPIYSTWSAEVAKQVYAPLLDVHNMIADRYDREGKDVVSTYFNSPGDPTHRNAKGAEVDAEIVLACLKVLRGSSLNEFLNDRGKAVPPADSKYVMANILPGSAPDPNTKLDLQPFEFHGNQDIEQDSSKTPKTGKVVIALAGDSTVTYDAGYAAGFRTHLDKQLQVINLSRGGRTTVSFRNDGRWQQILEIKPDYVMIQFGHNDGSRDLSLYSGDLARFVDEARAVGIKPILVTPISRRYWQDDGKIHSDLVPNVEVMKKVAVEKNVPLMDLHQRAIEFYEKIGRPVTETWGLKKANPSLATVPNPEILPQTVLDKTHFNPAGSQAIGKVVSDELKRVVPELAKYIE
jgi:lysophospholipase L1-like esterase